jgi:hypothetical protein
MGDWHCRLEGWKRALAKEKSAMALEAGYAREELREIREARWRAELQCVLHDHGHAAPPTCVACFGLTPFGSNPRPRAIRCPRLRRSKHSRSATGVDVDLRLLG